MEDRQFRRNPSERMLTKKNSLDEGLLRGRGLFYRQAIRLIINGIKIKAISLNAFTDIKSNAEVTHGLLLREAPMTQAPTVDADLALKDPTRSLKRIACDALEAAVCRGKNSRKVSLNQMKNYNKNCFPSSYKGGRMLNLESSLCLRLGSSSGGGE